MIYYYGCPEEGGSHCDKHDAIECEIDHSYLEPKMSKEEVIEALRNKHVEICAFRPIEIEPEIENRASHIIEMFLEKLDDEYGNPEDEYTKPTPSMQKAALEFAKAVISEYTVWACEEVPGTRETIDALAWAKEYRPDWLNK